MSMVTFAQTYVASCQKNYQRTTDTYADLSATSEDLGEESEDVGEMMAALTEIMRKSELSQISILATYVSVA